VAQNDAAIRAVSSPKNLSRFAEHGFKTVDVNKVVMSLTGTGLDTEKALVAARAAVEAVGGFVTTADRNAGLGSGRRAWRSIYEIWMVPEGVDQRVSRVA
jgi:hypothetical protein